MLATNLSVYFKGAMYLFSNVIVATSKTDAAEGCLDVEIFALEETT